MSDAREVTGPPPDEAVGPDEAVPPDPAGPDEAAPALGRGRPDRPALGWTEILVGALAYLAIQTAGGLGLLLAFGGLPSAPWLLALSATAAIGAAGSALVVRVRAPVALGMRSVPWRTLVLAAGVGLAVWVLSRLLILAYIGISGDVSDPQAALTQFAGGLVAVLVLALGGVLVPLGEELLFRGVLYGALRRYGLWFATIGSGLVFALAHGLNVVLPAALVLGVANAMLYERTRSVWPCVVSHAVFNLTSFGLLLLVR